MKILIILFSLASSSAYAINLSSCSSMLNKGMWRSYRYMGIDNPTTKATKDVGTTKATFVTSTESSTAFSDPKYYSNVSTSGAQSVSSFGDCAFIGFENVKKMRDLYFDQNSTEVLAQIAKGEGEFLNVLTSYSLCENTALSRYKVVLKNNFSEIVTAEKPMNKVDSLVEADSMLRTQCYSYN